MSDDKKKTGRGFSGLSSMSKAQSRSPDSGGLHERHKVDLPRTPRQPIIGDGALRGQRLYIDMPSSKKKIDCSHMLLDTSQCIPGPYNMRNQSLLTRDNQSFMALVDAIDAEGQRDPVLARPIKVNGETRYEVIYGTRRRAAVEYLAKTGTPDIKLRAWVGVDITDQDAQALALSENADRQDVSVWEKALFAQQKQTEKESVAKIAEVLRVSEKTVYAYLKLASIPQSIVAVFASPEALSLAGGQQIAAQIKAQSLSEEDLQALVAHFAHQKAKSALDVIKAIKGLSKRVLYTNKKQGYSWASSDTGFGFSVLPHRSKTNTFTLSLTGVDADGMALITQAIQSLDKKVSVQP